MSASCLLLTLNCAKRAQSSAELQALLESALEPLAERPHFLVIALQEAASFIDAAFNHLDEWLAPFEDAAASVANGAYERVAKQHVGAVALLVYGTGASEVLRVARSSAQFGLLWSNLKGAACLSLELAPARERLTFVSAHLAANEGRVAERNHDFALLYHALGLAKLPGQVVVAGDLNYRASNSSFESDELTREMRLGHTAWGLVESRVAFQPSFKYYVGTSEPDSKRTPSWCDRVLYRPSPDVRVHLYDSIMSYTASDHKPVLFALDSPTSIAAPAAATTVPAVRTPPVWISAIVDGTIGSALFLGTTRTGWLAIGFVVATLFFLNSF